MSPDPTGGSLPWALWFLGELAFKWVPGAVISAAQGIPGAYPSVQTPPPPAAITSAVTAPQIVQYLQTESAPGTYDNLFNAWSTFVAFSLIFSLVFFSVVVYCVVRMAQIRGMERRRFEAMQRTVVARDVPKTTLRWQHILEEVNAESDRSWRLAILEADIMLNELLDSLGYRGETMADKMRSADKADFHTLDLAWEAHRFRNTIAHEGDGRILSAREARRIVSLYERVFKEFKVIE